MKAIGHDRRTRELTGLHLGTTANDIMRAIGTETTAEHDHHSDKKHDRDYHDHGRKKMNEGRLSRRRFVERRRNSRSERVIPGGNHEMRFPRAVVWLFLAFAWKLAIAASAAAQATPVISPVEPKGLTWTETFEGSGNNDGFITDVNSTFGYIFSAHFSTNFGLPYIFVEPSTSKTGTTSVNGLGNPYLGLTYSQKGGVLTYSSSVSGAFPLSTTEKGLSTGRVTYDWSNHFDHGFDFLTPFLNLGVANSVPDTRYFHHPYISLGNLAHFEAGPEFDIGDKWSISTSSYYILPWGPQKIYERGKKNLSGAITGGPSLTWDTGANVGLDYSLSCFVGLSAGYSYKRLLHVQHIFLWNPVQPYTTSQRPTQ